MKFSLQGVLDLRLEFLLFFLKFIDTLLLAHFTVYLYWWNSVYASEEVGLFMRLRGVVRGPFGDVWMEKVLCLVSTANANPPMRGTALATQRESYPSHRRAQLAHPAWVHFQLCRNGFLRFPSWCSALVKYGTGLRYRPCILLLCSLYAIRSKSICLWRPQGFHLLEITLAVHAQSEPL